MNVFPEPKARFKMVKPGSQGQGLQACSFTYFEQAPFLQEKKKTKKKTQHAVTGVHNLLCVKAAAVTAL